MTKTITISDYAKKYKISRQTVYNWISKNKLKVKKITSFKTLVYDKIANTSNKGEA